MGANMCKRKNPKHAELMDHQQIEAEVEGAVAIVNAPNNESPPPICKMDIDCCEETFDYLALKDLRALGLTCKRMNAIAVHIFKESYPATIAYVRNGTITNVHNGTITTAGIGIHLHGYTRVIRSIKMYQSEMCDFNYIAENKFGSLKHIKFFETALSADRIERIKEILGQIETLKLYSCNFTGNLYEDMLKFCINLKRLKVMSYSTNEKVPIIGNGNEWLTQKYPNLEEFKLDLDIAAPRIVELDTFFVQNRSIRKFSVCTPMLEANKASIMASNLKLDSLEISLDSEIPFDLLDELHAKGFYQRLEINNILSNSMVLHENIKRMTLLHGLERIYLFKEPNYGDVSAISALVSLKELDFFCYAGYLSAPLAKQLIKLERIYFAMAYVYNFRDFIYYSANLKAIKVQVIFKGSENERDRELTPDDAYNYRICREAFALTDLPKWNRERAKLNGARKVKVFVDEEVYLKTKWALKATDFGLIEIKRIQACQWIY